MTQRKRVAIYARCSTLDQHPENQVHVLRRYAELRDWEVVEEFVDSGISGRRNRRPQLDAMRLAARRRRFDVVLAVKLDRLARSLRNLCEMANEWEELNVDLCLADQALDTSTSTGKLTFHVLGALADFESSLISERVKAGMEGARRRGVKFGGRKPVLDRKGRERVRRLRSSGKSLRAIAEIVGVSVGTIHATVKG